MFLTILNVWVGVFWKKNCREELNVLETHGTHGTQNIKKQ